MRFIGILLAVIFFACDGERIITRLEEDLESSASGDVSIENNIPYIPGFAVQFSEVDPVNIEFDDHEGDDPPWVEFYNSSEEEMNLSGLYLTNTLSDLTKWQFGNVNILPHQYKIVFLSGKNLPDVVMPSDTIDVVGRGVWAWSDEDQTPPGTSFVRKLSGESSFLIRNEDGSYGFGAEMQYGENPELGWHSACLFVGTGNSSPSDVRDLRGAEEILFSGFISKGMKVEVQLAQPDLDDWKGYGKTLLGTGDSSSVYTVRLPQGSKFPDLENIYGLRISPETNETNLLQIKISRAIARKHGHEAHASFKIKNTGGSLYLTNGEALLDSVSYPKLPVKKTWSKDALGNWGYAEASFSLAASSVFPLRADTLSMPPSGFYSEPFYLSFNNVGDVVRCETGGKLPTSESPIYASSVLVSETKVFRCAAFNENKLRGEISNRTYLFEKRPTLSTVFLTGDPEAWFSPDSGIYREGPNAQSSEPHYGANYWSDKELPVWVEFFEPGSSAPDFSENAGYQIFGNYSRMQDKKSAAITFREKYGVKRLEYPLFPEYPDLKTFRVFILRNNGSNNGGDYIRDRLASSVTKGLGVDFQKARPAIVYYNGEYFGIHNIRERSTEYYFETNYGLDPEKIDLLKADNAATAGSAQDYLQMISFLENNAIHEEKNYERISKWMDIDNFINYMQIEMFTNNRDWPANNLKKWRSASPATPWKWFLYDLDFGYGNTFSAFQENIFEFATREDGDAWPNGPESTFLLRTLLKNETFRAAFINRFPVLLATIYDPSVLKFKIDQMMAEIQAEISRDQERWNFNKNYMQQQLNRIYSFAENRSTTVWNEMQSFFKLGRAAPVILDVSGNGAIDVHGLVIPMLPVSIGFFYGQPVELKAIATSSSVFSEWSDGEKSPVRVIEPEKFSSLTAIFK